MQLEQLQKGDRVYASCHIYNDGGIPDLAEDALIAKAGTRGTIVETGHLEEPPHSSIYLVRFEDENLDLGPATGCLAEELSANKVNQ